ncbi:Hypothetical protein DEACI_0116 [Acididesulfobacillus acetoxydans]|uniref:Uncharacterized protein n=1 Tax=Acididesulfobacillus acetoxydans TaxID=1561005 RepID=A0A8S0X2T7_9FIRM|nr:hypothetical protein [Acididesulfobacillus acetoxydans]CAA7599490.1 Hypothetical protein DEACI_0116 [Acididesulfobacillus acetoxydans]CEJ09281.1 Hypothetical protein DEACI_3765 [Acididesulfobacillus acetoxydans]
MLMKKIYDIEDVPPLSKAVPLSFQHVFVRRDDPRPAAHENGSIRGLSLKSAENRLNLQIGLKVRRILHEKEN